MYELKKNGSVFTSKFVRTGPRLMKKRIYRIAVSQRLRNTGLDDLRRNNPSGPIKCMKGSGHLSYLSSEEGTKVRHGLDSYVGETT